MRREELELGFLLLELLMLPIYVFNKLRQVNGVTWTEIYQNSNMQATSLFGLLWSAYYLEQTQVVEMKYVLRHYFNCKEFSRTLISEAQMVSLCECHWCKRKPVQLYSVWPPAEFLPPPHYCDKMHHSLWGCHHPETTPDGCLGIVLQGGVCTGIVWLQEEHSSLDFYNIPYTLGFYEYNALLYFLFRWTTSVDI